MSKEQLYEDLGARISVLKEAVVDAEKKGISPIQTAKELGAINAFVREVAGGLDLDGVLGYVYKNVLSIADADLAIVYLLEGDQLVLPQTRPDTRLLDIDLPQIKKVGECLCGLAALERKPLYSVDIHSDPRCTLNECKLAGLRSFAALPILSGDRFWGVLGIGSRTKNDFAQRASFLEALAIIVSIALAGSKPL